MHKVYETLSNLLTSLSWETPWSPIEIITHLEMVSRGESRYYHYRHKDGSDRTEFRFCRRRDGRIDVSFFSSAELKERKFTISDELYCSFVSKLRRAVEKYCWEWVHEREFRARMDHK